MIHIHVNWDEDMNEWEEMIPEKTEISHPCCVEKVRFIPVPVHNDMINTVRMQIYLVGCLYVVSGLVMCFLV